MRLAIRVPVFFLVQVILLNVLPLKAQGHFSDQLKKQKAQPRLPKAFVKEDLPMSRFVLFQTGNLATAFVFKEEPVFWQEKQEQSQNSIAFPILGGLVAGAAGFFGGALVGYAIETSNCEDIDGFCGLGGAVLGAAIGETIFMPIGIHIGNQSQGDLAADFLVSLAIAAAGISMSAATDSPGLLIATPLLQLGVTVVVERNTGRMRDQ